MGIHFWIAIVQSLGRIRMLGIDEWAPPALTAPALLPFWLAAASFVALVLVRGPRLLRDPAARSDGQITLCICALMLLPPALGAGRNVPPFLLIAVPAIAALAPPGTRDDGTRADAVATRLNLAIAGVAGAAALLAVVVSYARGAERLRWDPLPARSLAALDGCRGN